MAKPSPPHRVAEVTHLFAIAYETDNLVAVRFGKNGKEFNLSKHSRPKDLQDVAAELLDAEEQARGELG